MQIIVQELRELVHVYSENIQRIPNDILYFKTTPEKWSKIEVLGHLIDSAQNNLRRFICGQYESSPPKIVYDQDFWVKSMNYQSANKDHIILLWTLLNDRICDILTTMPPENYSKQCDTGKQSLPLYSLSWFAEDYVKHVKHHLNQIIPGSFAIAYQ